MLSDAFFITRKDVQYMLREKESLLWLFIMPVVFFYFIGTITSGFGGNGPTQDTLAVVAEEQSGFLGEEIVGRLEQNGFKVARVESQQDLERYSRRLTLPAGLTGRIQAGEKVSLRFVRRESPLAQDYDQVRVNRAVYTVLADLTAADAQSGEISAESMARLQAVPRTLTLDVRPAGERVTIPTGFEQAIPGIMVMFTLIVLLTSGSVLLYIERSQGLLRRLASTPISRTSVVLGKWGGRMILAAIQIGFAMLAGRVLFGMDWGPNLPMVGLVMLGWAALCASLGLLLGSVARSEGQAVAIGVLSGNVLAALGGCWWPIEITPEWMQDLALALPTGWTMDALHRLVNFHVPAVSALPHVLILAVAALLAGWLARRAFRFQ